MRKSYDEYMEDDENQFINEIRATEYNYISTYENSKVCFNVNKNVSKKIERIFEDRRRMAFYGFNY